MLTKITERTDLHPSVLVSVRSSKSVFGKEDVVDALGVVDWHMPASASPMGYAISVRNDDNIRDMISKAGNFVVNFLAKDQERAAILGKGHMLGFLDGFSQLGVEKADCERVESPRVKDARAFLECELIQELESGDHTVFLGRIVNAKNFR
jgi:flavin reductase (DIM6/NTAB) family NADH-FMN oxidoreductase RutF